MVLSLGITSANYFCKVPGSTGLLYSVGMAFKNEQYLYIFKHHLQLILVLLLPIFQKLIPKSII